MIVLLLVFAATAGCETVSPQQQHAADQAKCAGYGYQPGTDQFAHCMMKVDTRREDRAVAQVQGDANMKALSIQRNGDTRFPVCGASMMDANLDTVNNAWYGPNCREK
ncbi:hypothetical protein [Dyella acidiphila]|uniref:DUF333 domain-containing protein n=1 Tax=Dyella acidiphila TaxID=2775866 RepID=A0ABR9GEV2_9GAMM|nr:hypothetical protein [Dyella acidiphila]MBE1162580.1 hypothetical protein [Dyella acidiphila]